MTSHHSSPLVKEDLKKLQILANNWAKDNPLCDVESMPRSRRIWEEGARAMYAIKTRKSEADSSLCQPCQMCGTWTHAYCECCSPGSTPFPVCSCCDADKLACRSCLKQRRNWEASHESHASVDQSQVIQVGGYMQDDVFIRLNPPLLIPFSQVQNPDGTDIDEALLTEQIQRLIKTNQ